ncbi:hypothetical protein [Corynebacterium gerontici]|uniref:Uncharacterized protein n=1 Tax=Corynebacterium gerontici TaxID=2079234 RepID=A0A3G6J2K3_9CORY|nr:hypothetical protein [Corynebacterium gerontici]AZA12136.1 hypothetical protein CGERO_09225 [Corynebacterium gerontici]
MLKPAKPANQSASVTHDASMLTAFRSAALLNKASAQMIGVSGDLDELFRDVMALPSFHRLDNRYGWSVPFRLESIGHRKTRNVMRVTISVGGVLKKQGRSN